MNQDSTPSGRIPVGTLLEVEIEKLQQNEENPRALFDPEPLNALKENIAKHGILVPLTVYQPEGTDRYAILDGARRYRCCQLLFDEGHERFPIKVNVIETPDRLAGLLAMFSIHNFREGWELMPTALALQNVMEQLGEQNADIRTLRELTGLSEPQIDRCRLLIELPEEFQHLSLDPDPRTRIPSNFWIEGTPVVQKALERLAEYEDHIALWRILVEKYRQKALRSVIHFRRVMESYSLLDPGDDDYSVKLDSVDTTLRKWLSDISAETRMLFDPLNEQRVRQQKISDLCSDFKSKVKKLTLQYHPDPGKTEEVLKDLYLFLGNLIEQVHASEPPQLELDIDE